MLAREDAALAHGSCDATATRAALVRTRSALGEERRREDAGLVATINRFNVDQLSSEK